jgi:hypothetical protein
MSPSSTTIDITPGEILLEEYLEPMGISQNAMGRAIGVAPRAISQRELPPENPTHQEIVKGFCEIGFIEVSEHSYYRKDDNILLGDAAPRNIRFENGTLVPFDAVAGIRKDSRWNGAWLDLSGWGESFPNPAPTLTPLHHCTMV